MAFENVRCGDSVIAGLLAASGPRGFEAFLPQDEAPLAHNNEEFTKHRQGSAAPVSVLPLGKTWKDIDFSLDKVKPDGETLRQFITRLILRYSYVMVSAPLVFVEKFFS